MTDERLAETLRDRLPRLHAAGVDPNDVETALSHIRRLRDWPHVWAQLAREHEALGDDARAAGNMVSASTALRRAALYFHVAQFVHFERPLLKYRLQERQDATYRRAAPHLQPPAARLEIPFEGTFLPGNLRIPDRLRPAPCVVLTAGADSTKEEFGSLEDMFLDRGLATFSYDGPGQGATRRRLTLRPDFEVPIGALLDALGAQPELDPTRIGLWGRSFGAYAALRGATDPRVRACVAIGGFAQMGTIWSRMPPGTTESLAYAFGATDEADAARHAQHYSLDGVAGSIQCPVLVVHSGRDNVCPLEQSERITALVGARAELVVFKQGNHVCDNIPYRVRPLMADWLAARLAG